MLYHICRYRDGRNQRAQSRNFHDDDDLDEHPGRSPWEIRESRLTVTGIGGLRTGGTTAYYDPARNNFQK